MALTKVEALYLMRMLHAADRRLPVPQRLAGSLREYLERFEPPRKKREDAIRKLATGAFHCPGELEIDGNAVVSEDLEDGDENGAYVLAWQWVSFEGTKFDKEKS